MTIHVLGTSPLAGEWKRPCPHGLTQSIAMGRGAICSECRNKGTITVPLPSIIEIQVKCEHAWAGPDAEGKHCSQCVAHPQSFRTVRLAIEAKPRDDGQYNIIGTEVEAWTSI